MNLNVKPSQQAPLIGVITPQSATIATSTGWIDMSLFPGGILATVFAGAFASTATLDAKLEQATTAAGAGVKDITGKAITQLTEAGTDDDKQVQINCQQEDLDIPGNFRFVRLTVTPATAAVLIAAIVQGFSPLYGPAEDLASVDEVVG